MAVFWLALDGCYLLHLEVSRWIYRVHLSFARKYHRINPLDFTPAYAHYTQMFLNTYVCTC